MQNIITHTSHHCDIEALKKTIIDKLLYTVGKDPVIATNREWLNATLYAVRDQLVERWHRSTGRSSPGRAPGLLSLDGVFNRPHIV
jgi:glucan phosphorylase